MWQRIEAGTAIAMIGAWDQPRGSTAFAPDQQNLESLEHDATAGHVFFVNTGGDGDWPVHVYLEEEIPEDQRRYARPLGNEYLLQIPSGKLVVGGMEDYRSGKPPRITGQDSIVNVPSGDYRLTCFGWNAEEGEATQHGLRDSLSKEDFNYYYRVGNRNLNIGCLLTLAAVVGVWILSDRLFGAVHSKPLRLVARGAMAITTIALVMSAYFGLAKRALARNARYQRSLKLIQEYEREHPEPALIFCLHAIKNEPTLQGGWVQLDAPDDSAAREHD